LFVQVALLVGGDSMEEQFEALTHNPDILIGTPGRVMHHLQVRHTEPFAFEGGRGGRRGCSPPRVNPWAVVTGPSRTDDRSAVFYAAPAAQHDLPIKFIWTCVDRSSVVLVLVTGWLQEVPDFTLASVQMVVYDEADRLFEMGFAEQLGAIMKVHTRSVIA
jgi:hypothetical protein